MLTEQFDLQSKAQLDSPNDYCLFICDGHDSHILAEFVDFTIKNKIELDSTIKTEKPLRSKHTVVHLLLMN